MVKFGKRALTEEGPGRSGRTETVYSLHGKNGVRSWVLNPRGMFWQNVKSRACFSLSRKFFPRNGQNLELVENKIQSLMFNKIIISLVCWIRADDSRTSTAICII